MKERSFDTFRYGSVTLHCFSLPGSRIYVAGQDLQVTVVPKNGAPAKHDVIGFGDVFVPRRTATGPHAPIAYMHYRSLYDALRARIYTLAGYDDHEEGGELHDITIEAESVEWLLRMLVGYGQLEHAERTRIREKLAELAVALDLVRNPHKVDARRNVRRGLVLANRNAGQSRMTLAHARNQMHLRLEEVRRIVPRISAWEAALILERDRIRALLFGVRDEIKELRDAPRLRAGMATRHDLEQLARACGQWSARLKTVSVKPFLSFVELSMKDLATAEALLADPKQQTRARERLDIVYRSVRTQLAGMMLEEIHLELGLLEYGSGLDPLRRVHPTHPANLQVRVSEVAHALLQYTVWLHDVNNDGFVTPIVDGVEQHVLLARDQLLASIHGVPDKRHRFIEEARVTVKKALARF